MEIENLFAPVDIIYVLKNYNCFINIIYETRRANGQTIHPCIA